MRTLPLLTIVCWLAASPWAFAADPPVFLVSEPPLPARLASIDSEWNITFHAGDKLRVVAAKDLAIWGRWREVAEGPQILLSDGGVIRADLLKLDDQSLVLGDATGLGRGLWDETILPKSAVRAVLWQPPSGTANRDKLHDDLSRGDGLDDRVLLVGGEVISGRLVAAPLDGRFLAEGTRPGQGVFQLSRGARESAPSAEPLSIPAAKVRAVQFAAHAPSGHRPKMSAWLGCRDGSLVQASLIQVQNDKVTLKLVAGGELVTTLTGRDDPGAKFWDEVTLIQPANPHVVWLSDLKTLGYKHIPFLAVEWPFQRDRSVTGGRLRLPSDGELSGGGSVLLKGLGMPSTSRLAYDVAGYRKFEAEIALDASAGRRGSVIFKVLLQDAGNQWSTRYESPVIRGGEPAVPISIDLKGAARMALIVEFADRGDELDHANWLNARLVR